MSSTNVDLGNVQYLYLSNLECNDSGANLSDIFQWTMPYINPKESPYMFIQVVQLYVDHNDGGGAGVPQHLRFINVNGLNSYSSGSYQLATLMERDDLGGHWTGLSESPMIQVPSNIQNLIFTLNENKTGNPITLGTTGCMDIVIKIVRPKQESITQNTLASYVRTMP